MLGDKYNNNSKKDNAKKSPTVYSKYTLSNSESSVDPSKLSTTYWNGLMKLSIAPFNEASKEYEYDKSGDVYLSGYKAKALADEITLYLEQPDRFANLGVVSGTGIINISNGMDINGIVVPNITIREVNEDGTVKASYLYEFKSNYHYTIRNYEESTGKFDKIYNNNLEIITLRDMLNEFYLSMGGAQAYAGIEYGKFDNSRTQTKLDSIAEKLGIEYKKNNNYSSKGRGNSSVFDKAEGRSYDSKDLEEIENGMM